MIDAGGDPELAEVGWVDAELAAEFPELGLRHAEVDARVACATRSPRVVRERLRELSNRFHGIHAITLRTDLIASAYRVFYRQIGLDPDTTRTPIEQAALERLLAGGFATRTLLEDALLIALIETRVPVWALEASTLDGPLGIRPAQRGEQLGRHPQAELLPDGHLVVADAASPVAMLFGDAGQGHRVRPESRRIALYGVRVAGVPEIHLEEALWLGATVLQSA